MRIRPDVAHIKISDFPRTPWAVSFGLRPALMKTFNYCRQYPDKMESLKAVLTFMMQKIGQWESAAREVQFEGGSQRKPLQSATFVAPALTTEPNGELQKFNQPKVNHSDAIDRKKEAPQVSAHADVNGAWVAPKSELPQRPAGMTHGNPLKQAPTMPQQQEMLLQTESTEPTPVEVGGAYQPQLTLEQVLAANKQQ